MDGLICVQYVLPTPPTCQGNIQKVLHAVNPVRIRLDLQSAVHSAYNFFVFAIIVGRQYKTVLPPINFK